MTDRTQGTNAMPHLYTDTNGVIHSCQQNEVHRGINLVWTDCGKDVPANKSFRSWEGPTCMDCALALDQQKLEAMGATTNHQTPPTEANVDIAERICKIADFLEGKVDMTKGCFYDVLEPRTQFDYELCGVVYELKNIASAMQVAAVYYRVAMPTKKMSFKR